MAAAGSSAQRRQCTIALLDLVDQSSFQQRLGQRDAPPDHEAAPRLTPEPLHVLHGAALQHPCRLEAAPWAWSSVDENTIFGVELTTSAISSSSAVGQYSTNIRYVLLPSKMVSTWSRIDRLSWSTSL